MDGDEPFLSAIIANPADRVAKLIYADWLDERDDPRSHFLRHQDRLIDLQQGDPERAQLLKQLRLLQARLEPDWLALVGGLRTTSEDEPDYRARIDRAVRRLKRSVVEITPDGHEVEILATAISCRTGSIATLESSSKWIGTFHDISYHLRLWDEDRCLFTWEPTTYNPFFGCEVHLLVWFADAVLFIYHEKHRMYIARIGSDFHVECQSIPDQWILDGWQITSIAWNADEVQRLTIPELTTLPPFTITAAAALDLLPRRPWITIA